MRQDPDVPNSWWAVYGRKALKMERVAEGYARMGQPTDTLWSSQPRTLLKHQVYRQYLHYWTGKICQRFKTLRSWMGSRGRKFTSTALTAPRW